MHIAAKSTLVLGCAVLLMANDGGCSSETTANQRERLATEQLTEQASTQVGMPGIVRFTEKRLVKMLYELRDNEKLPTITYIVDLNGKLHKVCDSAGYGIPYATQYSNPHRLANPAYNNSTALEQPEPNGLFMPAAAEGTWVMCLNAATKNLAPIYVEPRVIVSPFPLNSID
jgi:hypothetical protein